MVLAMTHEECVTTHVAQLVRSYRDLPMILYHFQTKERDEPRPRAGVLRTREFIMKDAYTFDRDREGLDAGYEKHVGAYGRIFDRLGLEWYSVESDVGMMGGFGAHEYMAPCPAGENDVALAPGYAANLEVASAEPQPVELPERLPEPVAGADARDGHRGGGRRHARRAGGRAAEGLPGGRRRRAAARDAARRSSRQRHQAPERARSRVPAGAGGGVRGPHRPGRLHRPGRHGRADPARPRRRRGRLRDRRQPSRRPSARRRAGTGLRSSSSADIRTVEAGDTVGGHAIRIEPAIEVGNIFKLGTRFSEPLGATYLDEAGKEQLIWMGSYGLGPARIAAAAVEQFADEHGIAWPRAIAPFDVELVGLGKQGTEERELAERLYGELREGGLDVLFDDRDAGPGTKFADAELLGVPLRLTVGRRTLEAGEIEAQVRRGRESRSVPLEGAAGAAADLWRSLP